jgi:phosphoesterase RecJ-like protein
MLDWNQWRELVYSARRVALLTHVRPDGDALGSCEALRLALKAIGKEARVFVPGSIPDRYHFLDEEQNWISVPAGGPVPEEFGEADLVVVADTGTWAQLGGLADAVKHSPARKIVLDHHETQDDLGAVRFVDSRAEATGRLAWQAIQALGVPVSPAIARALFVALATDTGWFHHSNTQPETFELATRLVQAGAEPHRLYEHIFEQNSLEKLRLVGSVLQRLQLAAGGRVCYGVVRLRDYEETGARHVETEDLIGYTRSIRGVEVGVLFMEQAQGTTKVSFRSRGQINVARLAERWHGGGHAAAAGAMLHEPLELAISTVLHALEKELTQQSDSTADHERI